MIPLYSPPPSPPILLSVEFMRGIVTRYSGFLRQSNINRGLLGSLHVYPHSTIMRSITPASQASTEVMWKTWIPTLIWQQEGAIPLPPSVWYQRRPAKRESLNKIQILKTQCPKYLGFYQKSSVRTATRKIST